MRLLITGSGERQDALRKVCASHGHTLPAHGPWDAAVLPLPRSSITEREADWLPRGQAVICGITDAAFDCLAARRGWRLIRVMEDKEYLLENAALTAEGAVFAAMNARKDALKDCRCLVVGFGRIGRALTERLRSLGAETAVAARREESRREAGENSVPMDGISRLLPNTDIVFNTVPENIFTAAQLSLMPRDGVYIELASPPYGIGLEEIKQAKVQHLLESGVPGRYCPLSAASALLRVIERTVKST